MQVRVPLKNAMARSPASNSVPSRQNRANGVGTGEKVLVSWLSAASRKRMVSDTPGRRG